METWYGSNSSDYDWEGEHSNLALMAHAGTSSEVIPPEDEADLEIEEIFCKEVFSDLTHFELIYSLVEILEKHELLKI